MLISFVNISRRGTWGILISLSDSSRVRHVLLMDGLDI